MKFFLLFLFVKVIRRWADTFQSEMFHKLCFVEIKKASLY